jgi:hypothetical protein
MLSPTELLIPTREYYDMRARVSKAAILTVIKRILGWKFETDIIFVQHKSKNSGNRLIEVVLGHENLSYFI